MDVPYCIVRGKSRLGKLVHKKTATAVVLSRIRPEDKQEFSQLSQAIKANFNEKYDEDRKKWGGGILSKRSRSRIAKLEKSKALELAKITK